MCVCVGGGLGHPQLTLLALIVPRFDPSARRSLWAAANTTGLLHLLPPGALWVGWCHRRGAKSIVRLQRKNGAAFVLISYENTSRWVKLQLICQSRRKCGKNLTRGKKNTCRKINNKLDIKKKPRKRNQVYLVNGESSVPLMLYFLFLFFSNIFQYLVGWYYSILVLTLALVSDRCR